jgi:hypothetical protein
MEFQSVTSAKRISPNHIVKLTALVAIRPHRHSFVTVTNVMKTGRELLGIPEGKYSQTFQSRLGDKWLTPTRMSK